MNDRFRPRTSRAFLEKVVRAALAHVGRPDLEVSLLLTDEEEIARLHGEFLGDQSATDVISFPLDDGVEIAVNIERARAVAGRCGHAIRAEIALYVVHGILHVCGHDDRGAGERRRMRVAEKEILLSLGQRITAVED